MEHTFQFRILLTQKHLYIPAVGGQGLHVTVDGLLVDWQLAADATVGFSELLQLEDLFY